MSKIWAANSGMEVDDVWDDTALIEMYEKSLQEINNSLSTGVTEKQYTSEDGKTITWKVGENCMAPFEENGKTEFYPAKIISISGKDDLDVEVKFFYYGNTTVAQMKDLWINEQAVAEAVTFEQKEKNTTTTDASNPVSSQSNKPTTLARNMPSAPSVLAPPVPPNIFALPPANQSEAMNSMLMSWYMSGYHTGYLKALTDHNIGN